VITCNRCGSMNPAGILNCQMCGTPLAVKIENEMSPRTAAQNQPPLPAWLETLRAGERPSANVPAGNSFSAADLLDEGTLPSWMRSGRTEAEEDAPAALSDSFSSDSFAQSAPQVTLRPSSQSGPNTGDDNLPIRSLMKNLCLPGCRRKKTLKLTRKTVFQRPVCLSLVLCPSGCGIFNHNLNLSQHHLPDRVHHRSHNHLRQVRNGRRSRSHNRLRRVHNGRRSRSHSQCLLHL
jgi:hypothetical protein